MHPPGYQTERVLIWGKTYPELSRRYSETVCTAGVRQDGTPIRLYPVPLRYLNEDAQYSLWDWVEVPVQKAESDGRPESYKIKSDAIQLVGHVDSDRDEWSGRRNFIFLNADWHFETVGHLKEAQRTRGASLGVVRPGVIERVYLHRKPAEEEAEYATKMNEIQAQRDMFLPEYKHLAYRTHEIRIEWRCSGGCPECARNPHNYQVLDWGLIELARKNRWNWEMALDRLSTITDLAAYDFRFFLGNMKAHPTAFTAVGLWYPKLRHQMRLL